MSVPKPLAMIEFSTELSRPVEDDGADVPDELTQWWHSSAWSAGALARTQRAARAVATLR